MSAQPNYASQRTRMKPRAAERKRYTVKTHMRVSATLVALLLLCLSPVSSAEVFRCKGSVKWGGQNIAVRLDVVLPDEQDRILTLSTHKGEFKEIVALSSVGTGRLEITESVGNETASPSKYKFLVTRTPDKSNSLVGFVVKDTYVKVLRADLWKKEKPFTLYSSDWDEVLTGKCE